MTKLLVNAPSGVQELISIGEGGGYFDPERVIWDERTDGPLPAITLGGMKRQGNGLVFDQTVMNASTAATLAPARAAALVRIDADVDAIYGAAIGNRQAEYEAAERQAQVYADADYTGTAPGMVASWASAKGWTGQQAAEDILAQAAAWRGAQDAIRAQRLLRKEQVRAAADAAAINTVTAAWAGFVSLVRQQLGLS
uniref:Putative tail protein n=1 Tax=viral metagenome TaxID=1070528 RepID=A0A6M3MCL4_9ZZZZ